MMGVVRPTSGAHGLYYGVTQCCTDVITYDEVHVDDRVVTRFRSRPRPRGINRCSPGVGT